MQFGLHVSKVTHPMPIGQRTVVVGIRIRVDIDALELAQNNTSQHLFQFRVVVGKLHIWPYLRPESRNHIAWMSPVYTKYQAFHRYPCGSAQ